MIRAWGASIELWMHAGSWESTREAFEWHEAKHGPFILEHCLFKRKLIMYRILLNHFERFDWLNAITRFDRSTGVRLWRFRCTLAQYKKGAKNCQLCVLNAL